MKESCPSLAAVVCIALFSLTFSEQASGSSGVSVDPSFGLNIGLDGSIQTALPLADGKLLIGGTFSALKGASRNGIARLNGDGSNDASFNPGLGADGAVTAIAVQADGKILLGGNFSSIDGQPRGGVALLDENGRLDPTFLSSLPGRVMIRNAAGTVVSAPATLTVSGFPEVLTFLSILPLVDGRFLLELSGPTNRSYVIETTANLSDWTAVFTNSTGSAMGCKPRGVMLAESNVETRPHCLLGKTPVAQPTPAPGLGGGGRAAIEPRVPIPAAEQAVVAIALP